MPAMTAAMLLAAGVPYDVYDWFVRTHGADAVSVVRTSDSALLALYRACGEGRLAFTGCLEFDSGTCFWYRDGKRHRDDGPAIENADGTRYWYRDGKPHRDDGPAIEFANGRRYWYRDGTQINPPEEK